MLRFFEPEPFSAATLDHRTPNQLGFAWESKLSDSRNDAILPLLPFPSSSSLLRNNFETNNEGGERNSSTPQGLESSHSYSGGFLMSCEDCDGFQLNTFSQPRPMNPVPGQASSMASNDAMDMKQTSQSSSKCNEPIGARKQRKQQNEKTIMRESKRQKANPQNPSFDESNQRQRGEGAAKKSQKLGDKITALQQLVSPFGKTDTASVLQEAGICIKVLHEQIRMLSLPHFVVEASPLLLGMELGLGGRGLCLVPISSATEYLRNQEHIGPSVLERMGWEAGIRLPN